MLPFFFFFWGGGGGGEGGEGRGKRGLFQSGGPKSNPCLNFQLDFVLNSPEFKFLSPHL